MTSVVPVRQVIHPEVDSKPLEPRLRKLGEQRPGWLHIGPDVEEHIAWGGCAGHKGIIGDWHAILVSYHLRAGAQVQSPGIVEIVDAHHASIWGNVAYRSPICFIRTVSEGVVPGQDDVLKCAPLKLGFHSVDQSIRHVPERLDTWLSRLKECAQVESRTRGSAETYPGTRPLPLSEIRGFRIAHVWSARSSGDKVDKIFESVSEVRPLENELIVAGKHFG